MSRRKNNRRKSNVVTKRRNRSRRINRNSTNIRYVKVNDLLHKREPYSRNNIRVTPKPQIVTAQPQTISKSLLTRVQQNKKTPCHQKLERNDLQRRRAFFKSHATGGSNRPEHKRTHKRC